MSLSDPIADMLTRIRNAVRVNRKYVNVRASKVCAGICDVLKVEGYIEDYKRVEDDKQGLLRIYLKYGPSGQKVVSDIQRVSRPGCAACTKARPTSPGRWTGWALRSSPPARAS